MSDELKTKLEKYLIDLYKTAILHGESQESGVLPTPESRTNTILIALNEIHQAYIEAGYILPGDTLYKMPKGKDLAREMAGLKQVIDDGVNTIELPVMMSGQEWYERFEEQLKVIEELVHDNAIDSPPSISIIREFAKEASKIPLITDEETNVANYSGLVRPEFKIYDSSIRLSGEEWYTRFQTALHENKNSTSIQGGWITINIVDEAAAKASGLK